MKANTQQTQEMTLNEKNLTLNFYNSGLIEGHNQHIQYVITEHRRKTQKLTMSVSKLLEHI